MSRHVLLAASIGVFGMSCGSCASFDMGGIARGVGDYRPRSGLVYATPEHDLPPGAPACEFFALVPGVEQWRLLEFSRPGVATRLRDMDAVWHWHISWHSWSVSTETTRPVLMFAPRRGGMHRIMWSVSESRGGPVLLAGSYSLTIPCHTVGLEVS